MSLCNYSVCIANFNKPFFKFTSNDQFNYLLVGLFCGFQFFLVVVVCLNKLKAARVQPVEASAESFLTHETSHLETSFIILGSSLRLTSLSSFPRNSPDRCLRNISRPRAGSLQSLRPCGQSCTRLGKCNRVKKMNM